MEKKAPSLRSQLLLLLYVVACIAAVIPEFKLVESSHCYILLSTTLFIVAVCAPFRNRSFLKRLFPLTFLLAGYLAEPGGTIAALIVLALLATVFNLPKRINAVTQLVHDIRHPNWFTSLMYGTSLTILGGSGGTALYFHFVH
jgi:uncharacterized membrane protein